MLAKHLPKAEIDAAFEDIKAQDGNYHRNGYPNQA